MKLATPTRSRSRCLPTTGTESITTARWGPSTRWAPGKTSPSPSRVSTELQQFLLDRLLGVTNASGQFSVTFTSATAGQVIGSATSNVDVGGLVLVRSTDGTANNSGPARKTFVDAKIIIAPDDTNAVGDPHTFTVTVFADNGDGIDNDGTMGTFDAVGAGEDVTVTLTSINGASAVPPGPFVGVTNANGQFSVTFTSATAGQVIGSATSNVDVGGLVLVRTTDGTGNNSGPARKTFVDAKITISPDGVNPVGQPHTFTVTVWADNGDGIDNDGQMGTFDRVGAGQTVTVTLDGIGGAIPDLIAPINLPPADPTVIVGATNGLGEFSVTFTSATTGQVIGTATSNVNVAGLILPRTTDGTGNNSGPATKTFIDGQQPPIVVGPDKSLGSQPVIEILNSVTGAVINTFLAYEASYIGGVRIATGDLTGDGIAEIVTAPGRNHVPLVRVFSQSGTLLTEFLAFDSSFLGGVDVAVGDVDGDGKNDIIAGQSFQGSAVRVFRNVSNPLLAFQQYKSEFFPFGAAFIGGVVVAAADMGTFSNGTVVNAGLLDGIDEIIVGNEAGMRSTVSVFDYTGPVAVQVRSFLPLANNFRGGISIDVARVNADLIPDIIVGAGNQGNSIVEVRDGLTGALITTFAAFTAAVTPSFQAPIHVASLDSDGNGIADSIVVVQGSDGASRLIRFFNPLTGQLQRSTRRIGSKAGRGLLCGRAEQRAPVPQSFLFGD